VDRTSPPTEASRRQGTIDVVVVAPARPDVDAFLDALSEAALVAQRTHDPEQVARAIVGGRPDVVVVDLRRGDHLGNRILDWVTADARSCALVITDAHDVDARIRALDLGAADYLTAPFATREAVARVERLIAQQRVQRPVRITAGDLTLNLSERSASRSGKHVTLTPREVAVLRVLIERSEQPVSKQDLLVAVWAEEVRGENVVEANVSSLRRKLHALGPPVIHTLHRAGYVFRSVPKSSR
jgi:two-component system OmpR family response regulator